MDKYANLLQVLKSAVNTQRVPLLMAEVVEITDESCTVKVDDLILTDVRLKATINESENRLLIIPKVGSIVVVGSLTGDLKDLVVLKVDEVDKVDYKQSGFNLIVDATDGKVSLKNTDVDFLTLMTSLVDLLKVFKVFTPSGPSGKPLPQVILKLNQFESSLKKLFK